MSKLELYDVSFEDQFGYIVWARSEKEALEQSMDHHLFFSLEDELIFKLDLKGKMTDLSMYEVAEKIPDDFWRVMTEMAVINKIELESGKASMVFEYTLNF